MKRYDPRVDSTRKKHRLPAWAVTPTFILGVVIVGAVVFSLASTGGVRPAMKKLRGGMHEMTGGLLNRKNKK